ncbi:MAG: hypothetical protein PHX54_05255 [Lentimicrobiaceae bacterium]|nr:hypothetical protein [Lentimicrobiaceae bacterium]
MTTRIVLVSLFLSLLFACQKKEDDMVPGQNYKGTLTLDYSRNFPAFTSTLSLPVEVSAEGQVFVSAPLPCAFTGESDKFIGDERIKIREEGTILIPHITASWNQKGNKQYLEVSLLVSIEGERSVWKWMHHKWQETEYAPFVLQNQSDAPMIFRLDNALLSEAVCINGCNDCWGQNNFRWQLRLHENP